MKILPMIFSIILWIGISISPSLAQSKFTPQQFQSLQQKITITLALIQSKITQVANTPINAQAIIQKQLNQAKSLFKPNNPTSKATPSKTAGKPVVVNVPLPKLTQIVVPRTNSGGHK